MDKYKVVIVDDDEVALKKLSIELRKNPYFSLDGTARMVNRERNLLPKYNQICCFWMWKCRI